MDVSVVIVNWRSRELLRACLRSVFARTIGPSFEVVVADNASFDGAGEMLRRHFPRVRFRQLRRNLGFSGANNLAARGARGRYLLFLNPDTELLSNAVGGMARFLDQHSDYQAVGCRLLGSDGGIQYTCARAFPTPVRQFCSLALLEKLFARRAAFAGIELRHWDHLDSREIECLSGACMMVRREAFESLGGFDEQLFMYGEDVDLCYRIRRRGGRIHYLADERVVHYGGGSSQADPRRSYLPALMQRESNLHFMRKHHGPVIALAFRCAVGVGSVVRIGAALALIALARLAPRRIPPAPGAVGKYRALASWSLGLRKVHAPS